MKIFLSEFVCGGGWPDGPLPLSLATEGRAMLLAVAEDLARVGTLQVVTTWDHRLPPPSWPAGVEIRIVRGQREEVAVSRELSRDADFTWVIAPECDDILGRRISDLEVTEAAALNGSVEAVRLCSDKLLLAEWLADRGIPTPRTMAAARTASVSASGWSGGTPGEESSLPWPIVVKPRDGAGSQSTFVVSGPGVLPSPLLGWETVAALMQAEPWPSGWIVQPFVAGRAITMAAIVRGQEDFELLPAGEQHLSSDGRLSYRGGTIPAPGCPTEEVESLVSSVIRTLPGLRGWVGFDLLLPEAPSRPPLLIEINPRLTTSYIGYRALLSENLAGRIVDGGLRGSPPATPLSRGGNRVEKVRFLPDGVLKSLSDM